LIQRNSKATNTIAPVGQSGWLPKDAIKAAPAPAAAAALAQPMPGYPAFPGAPGALPMQWPFMPYGGYGYPHMAPNMYGAPMFGGPGTSMYGGGPVGTMPQAGPSHPHKAHVCSSPPPEMAKMLLDEWCKKYKVRNGDREGLERMGFLPSDKLTRLADQHFREVGLGVLAQQRIMAKYNKSRVDLQASDNDD
jgi:hypothetical protein